MTPPPTESAPDGLAALSERRRESLLWRYALELDYDGVDDRVRDECRQACNLGLLDDVEGERIAALGDDGRYHLLVDHRLVCRRSRSKRPARQGYSHAQECSWWTDGTRYRRQRPVSLADQPWRPDEHRWLTVRWRVHLTDQTRDPSLIPPHGRCQEGDALRYWPPYNNPATPLGRIRARLIAELGDVCQACRRRIGVFVDHDHVSNQVRGLLCHSCNTHVDRCPHPTGCPWADYLNDPPAAALGLTYPNRGRRGSRQKIEYFGFDLLSPQSGRPTSTRKSDE